MSELIECWLPIVGHEGRYEVSDRGRVRSLDRIDARGCHRTGRVLTPGPDSMGYQLVNLYRDGRNRSRRIHLLVIETFVGPRPEGRQVRHLDGDPTNNRLENLAYGTPSQNALDRVAHGTDPNARKTECLRGHPYTPESTYTGYGNRRKCRICARAGGRG